MAKDIINMDATVVKRGHSDFRAGIVFERIDGTGEPISYFLKKHYLTEARALQRANQLVIDIDRDVHSPGGLNEYTLRGDVVSDGPPLHEFDRKLRLTT